MREAKASEAQIEQRLAHLKQDDHFYYHPDATKVLAWFFEISDLFVYNGPFCSGLNLSDVEAEARMSRRKFKPNDYRLIKAMGREATLAINERLSRK